MENIFTQKRELSGDGKYWKKEADIAREKVKELEERNKVLEDALRTIYNIENAAFNLSGFDVTRLKKEIEEALLNNHK